jgi:D-serine deaminase-like pyridoxal phosphate-dependent protein
MKEFDDYKVTNIDKIDTPALLIYPQIVKRNIQHLISLFSDVNQIRPHVKTHKCPQIVQLLKDAGITKFKCATIAEAEMLASVGVADILMAYQPLGPKIERFINLVTRFYNCSFSCLIDNSTTALAISDAAQQAGLTINCFIDLDTGMNRTGIKPDEEAKELFSYTSQLPGINIIGVHSYDGHLTDHDVNIRLSKAEEGYLSVLNLVNDLNKAENLSLKIVAGSSPTLTFYAKQEDVECCPGTFIYWDQCYREIYPDLSFEFAALVVTRVISKPDANVVCLDLGYKAIASEESLDKRVKLLNHSILNISSQSEEHLLTTTTKELPIEEIIYGIPYHIGRTCNLYESVAVVEDHLVSKYWTNAARSRKISI